MIEKPMFEKSCNKEEYIKILYGKKQCIEGQYQWDLYKIKILEKILFTREEDLNTLSDLELRTLGRIESPHPQNQRMQVLEVFNYHMAAFAEEFYDRA